MAGHDAGRGEVDGLLTGPALPVDGHARDALRPARRQHRGAADVERLLAGLHDAAPDDIVHDRGVDTGALAEAVEYLCRQLARVHPGQAAVALADRRPYRFDDNGFRHELLLSRVDVCRLLTRAPDRLCPGRAFSRSANEPCRDRTRVGVE